MNSFLAVLKKDLKRFFTDKRILISLTVPLIMIFFFSFLGSFIGNKLNTVSSHITDKVIVIDENNNLSNPSKQFYKSYQDVKDNYKEYKKTTVEPELIFLDLANFKINGEFDTNKLIEKMKEEKAIFALVIDGSLEKDDIEKATIPPKVDFFVDKLNNNSKFLDGFFHDLTKKHLDEYFPPLITIHETQDIVPQEQHLRKNLSMFLPFILLCTFISVISSFVPTVIAEEKEKGTLATVLVTPCNRTAVAFAKTVSTSIIGLTSIGITVAGLLIMILISPLVSQLKGFAIFSLFNALDYFLILILSITTLLVLICGLMFVSGFAKSVKEANNYITPFIFFTIAIAYLSFVISADNFGVYFVPILNSVVSIKQIVMHQFNIIGFLIQLIVNIGIIFLSSFGLARLFNNEKIMYNAI